MAENLEDFVLVLHEADNVAVLKRPIKRGTELTSSSAHFVASRDIPAGHKIARATYPLQRSGPKVQDKSSDSPPGRIAAGDHVHTHNVAMKDFGRDYQFCSDVRADSVLSCRPDAPFSRIRPARRPGRHAQLRGGHFERELLRVGFTLRRGSLQECRVQARFSQCGWRHRLHAQERLRDVPRRTARAFCSACWPASRGIRTSRAIVMIGLGCEVEPGRNPCVKELQPRSAPAGRTCARLHDHSKRRRRAQNRSRPASRR